jgi:hypothetical protein
MKTRVQRIERYADAMCICGWPLDPTVHPPGVQPNPYFIATRNKLLRRGQRGGVADVVAQDVRPHVD